MSATRLAELFAAHVQTLRSRYPAALSETGHDALVIHAGCAAAKDPFDDQHWPLVPTPTFCHWLPLIEEHATVVVIPGKTPTLYRITTNDYWHSPAPAAFDFVYEHFDVKLVDGKEALGKALRSSLPGGGAVSFIGRDPHVAVEWGFADEHINPDDVVAACHKTRVHKTPYEIACLAEANRIAAIGHHTLAEAFADGALSEHDLHLAYLTATGQDALTTPYGNIVALDRNAAVLHHTHYGQHPPPSESASLLVDAGAKFHGYCSDITRTVVIGQSSGAAAFSALIDAMEELQRKVCGEIRVGMPYEDLHERAHALLGDVLRTSGIARPGVTTEALVSTGVTRTFLPHGLGHSLGLQVHDVGSKPRPPRPHNPFLRNTSTVEVGNVFTIEPGCYFIDALLEPLKAGPHSELIDWRTVELLHPFGGIRIEDNIHVTDGEIQNLTRDNWPSPT